MRIFTLILYLALFSNTLTLKAQENIYSDELLQMRSLNTILKEQLSSATKEISQLQSKNCQLKVAYEIQKELEKTKKELEIKTYEIRELRQKLMISQDENFHK